MSLSRRVALVGLSALALSACVGGGGTFQTAYDPLPRSLKVSEAKSLLPAADIVWREDPLGDRYAQVDKIMTDAITQGARGLRGSRPVIIDVTMLRFHALTFEAELRNESWGVHNVQFTAEVRDARSGEVLVPRATILAETPAFSGAQMREARRNGTTQKSMITNHVARTIAGWLGTGPDNRGEFSRRGN
jgi:hypothetical protein